MTLSLWIVPSKAKCPVAHGTHVAEIYLREYLNADSALPSYAVIYLYEDLHVTFRHSFAERTLHSIVQQKWAGRRLKPDGGLSTFHDDSRTLLDTQR